MPDPIADLIDALSDGPRNFYDLEDHLIELGYDLGPDPDAALEALIDRSNRIVELEEAVVVDPIALFDGTTFTADFSESHDLIDHQADLLLVALLAESQLPLSIDGEDTGVVTHDKGYRLHHTRWLHLTEPGVLTGFRLEDGRIDVIPRLDDAMLASDVSVIVGALERFGQVMSETKLPMELEPVLFEIAAAGDRSAFGRVLPPMTRLLEDAGLEYENMMIVPAGFDWDEWLAAQAEAYGE